MVVSTQTERPNGYSTGLVDVTRSAMRAGGALTTQLAVPRILLVEDNPGDVVLLRQMLSETTARRFEIEEVSRLSDAARRAACGGLDLIVLDLTLPDSSGIETFETMRRAAPTIPIVVLTGSDDVRLGLTAVDEGAQDYLVKGEMDGHALARALLFAIGRDRFHAHLKLEPRTSVDGPVAPDPKRVEENFRQLADNIAEVFYVMDVDCKQTHYINLAYERVWGQSCKSLYENPSSFFDPLSDVDRARFVSCVARVHAGEHPAPIEFQVSPLGRTPRWVVAHAVPIRNERGEIYRVSGFALDVTERRHAQEAMLASERRLLTLFETVDLFVMLLDAHGNVEYLNPFALRLTGYSHDEAFGQNWATCFVPESQRTQMSDALHDLTEFDHHARIRIPIVTKAGAVRMISWRNAALRDDKGTPTGCLSVGEDVTGNDLIEEQYRQADKLDAIGRLAAGAAHDFNNLLTVVITSAELLRTSFAPGDQSLEDLEAIAQAADAAAALTRQLLVFGRPEATARKEIAMEDVVARSVKLLRRVVDEDIAIHTALKPTPSTVMIDSGQLEQVIMNLAVNARDAMPHGGTLAIETSTVDLDVAYASAHWPAFPGNFAVLTVSDTGVGMDEATRARIFEPFFTTKEAGKGTGLGLATVYGIVKQSGGFIQVLSEPGQGTEFRIYLPLVNRSHSDVVESAPSWTAPRGSETILLVEDATAVRAVARHALERFGYTVLEASSGLSALHAAATRVGPIDMLLTDVVMPGMSGRELAKYLRMIRPETQVLFMSGYTDDAVLRHGVVMSGIAYLQKPFGPDALARKVREILDAYTAGIEGMA
ncbi:MAG: response regulator [bacterium]